MSDPTPTAPRPVSDAPLDGTRILGWSWGSECWQVIKFYRGHWVVTWTHELFPGPDCWLPCPGMPEDVRDDVQF
jgi:hypothetical protein